MCTYIYSYICIHNFYISTYLYIYIYMYAYIYTYKFFCPCKWLFVYVYVLTANAIDVMQGNDCECNNRHSSGKI